MRTFYGIVVGIAATIGAAYLHDGNVRADAAPTDLTQGQIVNWDVLGAVIAEKTTFVRGLWEKNAPK